jgi:hypothetical protein
MAYAQDASARWTQLQGQRSSFITRCEKYAGFTIPKLCLPQNYNQNSTELMHDFQAVGAQAVNHLANKIMLALFAPSRPFFRLDADLKLRSDLAKLGVDAQKLTDMLAQGEKESIAELDRRGLRPKLYDAIKHLIVLGNCLMILGDEVRVVGIKNYTVRRSMTGRLLELVHADKVMFDELDPAVQQACIAWKSGKYANQQDMEVTLYRWIKRGDDGLYYLTQWVDNCQLPKAFNGSWTEEKLPYRVLTWDLSDDAHYGTGLVEDYQGDFAGLSTMQRSQITGAVLASEFRWLIDPAGMTKPEDFQDSENGAALPGRKDDVHLVQSSKSGDLQLVMSVASEYITRIGRGFLLGSSVTRDAERVTAEEIRMQANELETSLGGAYSRLAVDFQIPMAYWLLDIIGLQIGGNRVRPSIVTGLEALSRTGDLEELKLWLADMAAIAQFPEPLQAVLKMDNLARALATPRRIKIDSFLKSPEELAKEAQAMAEQQAQQQATETGIQTAGKVIEQGATPQTQG